MSLLSKLFKLIKPTINKTDSSTKAIGKLVSEITDGANLVDGKQTWELAQDSKNDLEAMKKCCDAELLTMENTCLVPAPFYFERVAILSRKQKNYVQEVFYCENYIEQVESFYIKNGTDGYADVRKGPRYQAIVKRLPKAKSLLEKMNT